MIKFLSFRFSRNLRLFLLAVIALLLVSEYSIAQKSPSSEADLKKQADKQFDNDDFSAATPLYSQLLSLYPKNSEYNYRYGVCLLLSSEDRSSSVTYLEIASKYPTTDVEVYFYLGKSYMTVSNYTAALSAFEKFKKTASSGKINKLNVELLVNNCKSARELAKNRKNVVILNQQQVAVNSFYTAYTFDSTSGKILTTSERFLSSEDKKKIINPTMFLTNDGQTVYYASYGKGLSGGKDIFRIRKSPDGSWGEPKNLGFIINTSGDEDYPYLDHDGITLYFSSKGHNSMGGYDIFKSVYDMNSGQWSLPENVGIPINTSDDDVLYVPSYKGDFAQYASAIESDMGKIGVRKIKLGDVVNDLTTIQGQFVSSDQPQRKDAKISVIRISDNGLVTSVRTDPRNGTYKLDIPPGEDYTLVIEAGGYLPHAENFSIPEGMNFISLKQEVKLVKTTDVEKLTLSNYFTVDKKQSDDAPATVSSEPTNVISNEYHLNNAEQSKMQAIDIKGRTVYVVPPKNIIETKYGLDANAKSGQSNDGTLAVDDKSGKKEAKTEKESKSSEKNKVQETANEKSSANKKNSGKSKQFTYDELKTPELGNRVTRSNSDKDAPGDVVENYSEESNQFVEGSAGDVQKSKEDVLSAEHKNGVAGGDQVSQISTEPKPLKVIHDETSAETDPEIIAKKAEVAKKIASEQDSVSKTQIVEAKELLLAGGSMNMEKSKSLFKDSESNKKQSDARIKKAELLEDQAKQAAVQTGSSVAQKPIQSDSTLAVASTKNQEQESQPKVLPESDSKSVDAHSFAEADLKESAESDRNNASSNKSKKEKKKEKRSTQSSTVQSEASKSSPNENGNSAESKNSNLAVGGESFSSGVPVVNNETIINSDQKNYAADNGNGDKATAKTSLPLTNNEPLSPNTIKAKESYHEHEQMMIESQQMSAMATQIENKINDIPASPKRDSLRAISNDLNLRSVRKWQEAQQKLSEAKQSDPKVEVIVKEENKNKPKNDAPLAADRRVPERVSPKPSTDNKVEAFALTTETKKEVTSEKTDMVKTSTSNEDMTETNLDVNSPLYPEYIATKEKIKAKQTETIDVFADGVRLNKLAQQKKEEEITSREKVNLFTDANHKMQEQRKTSVLKSQADSLDALSQVRFRTAQLTTGEVVILNHKAANLKAEMNRTKTDNQNQLLLAKQDPSVSNSNATSNPLPRGQVANKESVPVVIEKVSSGKQVAEKNSSLSNEVKEPEMKKTSSGMGIKKSEQIAFANVDTKSVLKNKEKNKIIADATKPLENFSSTNSSVMEKQANDNIFSYTSVSSYNSSNPIPMNPTLPTGLVFKVQIGAFHSPLPDHIFKNLQPVSGETTRPGWIRYCVGMFKAYESANRVKAEMKIAGYKDAFVVAYYNGKRISMSEAFVQLNQSSTSAKKLYASTAAAEAAHLKEIGAVDATSYLKETYNQSMMPATSNSLNKGSDQVEYAVQVGVYKSSTIPKALASLMPLRTEKTRNGMYRFVTPRYPVFASADASKKNAVSNGIKDAFIIAYRNGSKVSIHSVNHTIGKTDVVAKGNAAKLTASSGSEIVSSSVVYKVQIGAFRQKVSDQAMNEFRKMSTDAISQETTTAGLQVYYSGELADVQTAIALKNAIVSKGIKDAFVVAFQNGKKIPLRQAALPSDKK